MQVNRVLYGVTVCGFSILAPTLFPAAVHAQASADKSTSSHDEGSSSFWTRQYFTGDWDGDAPNSRTPTYW